MPETVLQLGCEMLGADQAVVYLPDARQGVAPVAWYPDAAATHAADALDGARLTWHTLQRSLPQLVDCAHDDEARWEYCRGGECRPILSVPLQWEGQNFAVVQLAYVRQPGAIAPGWLGLVYEYANLATLALVQHLRLSAMAGWSRREIGHGEGANESSCIAGVSAALAASESERERIARDLHDGARQALLGAQLHLAALREALLRDDGRAMETHLIHGQMALDTVEQELVRVVRDLSPPRLDEGDLAAALRELAEQWAAATQISMHCAFDPGVPSLEVARAV
ncbi:MAG: sensor histidine kinase, partial [Chloroflexaceae bacterium]